MLKSGIGYSIEDTERHMDKIALFASRDMRKEAFRQRNNLHQCIWNCLRGINYDYLEVAALQVEYLHTENSIYQNLDIDLEHHTEQANRLLEEFAKLSKSFDQALSKWDVNFISRYCNRFKKAVVDFLKNERVKCKELENFGKNDSKSIKKMINDQLKVSFPERFSDISDLNFYTQIKNQMVHELRFIIEQEQHHKEAAKNIEDYFVSIMVPKDFDGQSTENVIIKQKKAFEEVCIAMMTKGIKDPAQLSVMSFYSAINHLSTKKQNYGFKT